MARLRCNSDLFRADLALSALCVSHTQEELKRLKITDIVNCCSDVIEVRIQSRRGVVAKQLPFVSRTRSLTSSSTRILSWRYTLLAQSSRMAPSSFGSFLIAIHAFAPHSRALSCSLVFALLLLLVCAQDTHDCPIEDFFDQIHDLFVEVKVGSWIVLSFFGCSLRLLFGAVGACSVFACRMLLAGVCHCCDPRGSSLSSSTAVLLAVAAQENNRRVLLHCTDGHSISATLVISYMLKAAHKSVSFRPCSLMVVHIFRCWLVSRSQQKFLPLVQAIKHVQAAEPGSNLSSLINDTTLC